MAQHVTLPIYIIGMPGTGKTSIAHMLSSHLKLDVIDIDQAIESDLGTSISSMFKNKGESYFRNIESEYLKKTKDFKGIVSTGGGIILDPNNQNILKEHLTFMIDTPLDILKKRLQKDTNRPLLQTVSLETLYNNRYPIYLYCATRVFNNEGTLETLLHDIITYMER